MKGKSQVKIVLSILIGLTGPAISFASDAAQNGAQFLRMPAGARASSLGGAYSALADDAFAIFWNPASLLNSQKKNIGFTHAILQDDMASSWLAFVHPLNNAALGIGVQYMSYGSIPGIDENNNDTGEFSPNDMALSVGYSRKISQKVSGGITAKYIRSKITETATALATDVGLNYAPSSKASLSLSLQNLGQKLKYISDSDPLPLLLSAGATYSLPWNIKATAQYFEPFDYKQYLAAGLEYTLVLDEKSKIMLRSGWSGITSDVPGTSGLALGFGVIHHPYVLDYSFAPLGDLGSANKISFGASF